MNQPESTVEFVQITDTHLTRSAKGSMLGVNVRASAGAVIAAAHGSTPKAQAWLLTGDLSQDGSPESYSALFDLMGEVAATRLGIPGNHDVPDVLARALTERDSAPVHADAVFGRWAVVRLDTTIPKVDGGRFQESDRLSESLKHHADAQRHVLLVMHHPPIPTNTPWLDTMLLDNPDDLGHLVDAYPGTLAVVCGHVHQEVDTVWRGRRLFATPSTCFQFTPGAERFSVDPKPPGWRVLRLHPDGSIETEVKRLSTMPAGFDPTAPGY